MQGLGQTSPADNPSVMISDGWGDQLDEGLPSIITEISRMPHGSMPTLMVWESRKETKEILIGRGGLLPHQPVSSPRHER